MKEFLACLFLTLGVMLIIAYVKNEVTYRNQKIIACAIYAYNIDLIRKGEFETIEKGKYVSLDDMEDYDDTLKRFWDWGYTRILPPEKYEIIKPYIKH